MTESNGNSQTTSPHAIIVEDDEALALIFSHALSSAGFSIEVIENGRVALNRLMANAPDLLLLDLNLPEVAGDEIIEAIYQTPAFANTRIVLATANARLAHHIRDKVDLVLNKPIRFSMLKRLASRFNPMLPF